jgi:hypothetical protein
MNLRAVLGAGCLAVILVSGCAVEPEIVDQPIDPGPSNSFEAEIERRSDHLVIRYTYVNKVEQSVVLFNGLPAVDGAGVRPIDPDAVYVHDGGDSTAVVYKGLTPPRVPRSGAPFTLRGTVVAPDQQFSEEMTVPWPLEARVPFDDTQALTAPTLRVAFCLHYASVDAVHALPGGNTEHPVYAHDSSTGQQWSACSPSVPIG